MLLLVLVLVLIKRVLNEIAGAIKGIVEAAKKVEGVKFEPKAAADAAGGDGNKKAGKLFGTDQAAAEDVKDAAAAVGAVSGEQILNAIVTAAGKDGQDGKAAGDATNAIEAAIGGGGGAAEFGTDNDKIGKKNDQIAAALVLRGVAKSGKFAGAADETEKVKAVVESAVVKTFGEWLDELIKAAEGGGKAAAAAGDVNKAAAAVGAVSGEQILNAIVTAAGKDGQDGKAAGDAKNAIEAAIGGGGAAAEFGTDNDKIGKKNDQIAAALVLRGVAKDGKFAGAANNAKEVKAVVESAVVKTFGEWLDELIKAAEGGGKAADGGGDKIGNVADGGGGAKADATSVNGIAGAIKGIVEAAKKVEGVKFAPTATAEADNKKAGKLFGTNAGAHAEDVNKAAAAVGAVSGEQILNAIVTAAGQAGQDGQAAGQATNAIEAAIGGDAAADFGNDIKKKNDQIAAALVLRGVAKSGKFAGAANNAKEVKAVVESAVVKTVGEWLDGLIKAADGGGKAADGGGGDKIGNVDAAGGGAKADKESVNGIAGAIKGIVEAAKKVEGVKFEPTAAADADNKKAGKLFGTNAAAAADVKDAAAAVGAVSGEQILNAIVTAAGKDGQDGQAAGQATNAIEAAIGGAGGAADFGNDIKKKNDQIALTSFIVLPLIYIIFI